MSGKAAFFRRNATPCAWEGKAFQHASAAPHTRDEAQGGEPDAPPDGQAQPGTQHHISKNGWLPLSAKDVAAGVNHFSHTATVACGIAQANQRDAVHHHLGAAFDAFPGIGPAAQGMDAFVAYPQRGLAVDEDVR